MKNIILQKLSELEELENIKILYACESGSRAWGFTSPDSDFDVRFIYTRKVNQYLSITEIHDVVELPVDKVLDISGWDLKKALNLFLKSNGPLYEWLQSPIGYKQNNEFLNEIRSLMPTYFSPKSGANHYLSMAHNTLRDDLQSEQVKLKRYFYAIRPALACLWIVENQTVPPMELNHLSTIIKNEKVQEAINELLEQKEKADESAYIPKVVVLNNWLSAVLKNCKEQVINLPSNIMKPDELNEVFRNYI